MLTVQKLKQADARVQAAKFIERAIWIAKAGSTVGTDLADAGAPKEIVALVRAQTPGLATDSALAELRLQSQGFIATIAASGLIDGIIADALPGALNAQFAIAVSDPAAGEVADGRALRVTSMGFARRTLTERPIGAIAVLSKQLLRHHGVALELFERLIRQAVTTATDAVFVPELLAGAPTVNASGISSANVYFDIRTAVAGIPSGPDSRFRIGVGATLAKRLALATDETGARAFPAMRVDGGTIADIPVSVSAALSTDAMVTDASAMIAGTGDVVIERTESASLEMATDPTSAAHDAGSPLQPVETTQVSMFQNSSAAIKVTRALDLVPMRATHTVKIAGAGNMWGLSDITSPAS